MSEYLRYMLQITIEKCREVEAILESGRELPMEEALKAATELSNTATLLRTAAIPHHGISTEKAKERLRSIAEGRGDPNPSPSRTRRGP